MKNKDKILDDLARVAGGTVSAVSDLAKNLREDVKSRAHEVAANLDLVPREDFERLEKVLLETRALVEDQAKRIAELEKAMKPAKAATPKKKSAPKAPQKKS